MENANNFRFKKEFGQNFIFDKNFLISLVKLFNLGEKEQILEIGAGAGTLTEVLATSFDKVISVEIDKTLTERLKEIENKHENLSIIFNDVLKLKTSEIDEMFNKKEYNIIANLPYYITSQIIFKFLLESSYVKNMFVMVQKEVGERFSSQPNSKEYGVPSVLINTFGSCKILKYVSKKMFTPQPKVDSCVIEIKIDKAKFNIDSLKEYSKFITNCFLMKRKTLYNNLIKIGYAKEVVLHALKELEIAENSRPENVSSQKFVALYNFFKQIK